MVMLLTSYNYTIFGQTSFLITLFGVRYEVSMDNQNQNIQPDYSFIVNQASPADQKPSGKRKFILIGGGLSLLVLFVVGVVGLTMSVKKNIQPQYAQENTIVNTLITDIQKNDAESVNNLFDPAYKQQDASSWSSILIQPLNSRLNIDECKVGTTTVRSNKTSLTEFSCPYKSTPQYSAKFAVESVVLENKRVLKNVIAVGVEKV
jgi:hypothetical protein